MFERQPGKRDDEVLPYTKTLPVDRAQALGEVLSEFGLPCRVVASEGAQYPDGKKRVPKGEVFVTYDIGEVSPMIVWRMVAERSSTPRRDGRR